jgi:hypothetical protein
MLSSVLTVARKMGGNFAIRSASSSSSGLESGFGTELLTAKCAEDIRKTGQTQQQSDGLAMSLHFLTEASRFDWLLSDSTQMQCRRIRATQAPLLFFYLLLAAK